ncbi:MAG: type II 3-dehydroquinate dehydratase [Bacteroidetes bacterium HGW-Bacteroidetes-21]|jgi:3-dehydroquinate dehydratase-2|nr:MAG: type II 3-dehydroquinate dehydratase [Bacteroidetes bacterium HGW-Bacteroidetes-21]
MKILILNGPNLNLLGTREPGIYGNQDFESFLTELKSKYPKYHLNYFQSNIEGEIINALQQSMGIYDYIIINPAGYSHTSVAIADAIKAISIPVIEVHISNIFAREEFRHSSITAGYCIGSISGFGLDSYLLAIQAIENIQKTGATSGNKL